MGCPFRFDENCNYQEYDHCEKSKELIKKYFCEDGGFSVCRHFRKLILDNLIEEDEQEERQDSE